MANKSANESGTTVRAYSFVPRSGGLLVPARPGLILPGSQAWLKSGEVEEPKRPVPGHFADPPHLLIDPPLPWHWVAAGGR